MRPIWPRRICQVFAVVLFVLSTPLVAADSPVKKTVVAGDVRWIGDDLMSPLPEDRQERARALQELGRRNAPSSSAQTTVEDIQPTTSKPVLPVQAPLKTKPQPEMRMTNAAAGLLATFNGIPYNAAAPANPDIAAGTNHVVVTAGDEFAVYDKCGTWHDGGDISNYFPVPSNLQFSNGRVIYDDWDSRWIMSFVANTFAGASFVYVFVSNNSNPLAGWYFYAFAVTTPTEYPNDVHLAVDPDIFYFTFDHINLAGGFIADAAIWYADKSDVYANAAVTPFSFSGFSHLPDLAPAVGIRPSQLRSFDGNMYFVGCNIDGGGELNIRTILDPLGTPSVQNTVVSVPAYTTPPNGQQSDNTFIEAGDARFTDVVYFAGNIYATRTFDSGGSPMTYIELIEMAGPSHVTSATSTGSAASALDVDESGAVTLVRASHSTSSDPSAVYTVLDFQPLLVHDSGGLAFSQGLYQQGGFGTDPVPYQLADYFGAALDPTDKRTIWSHGVASSNAPAGTWRSVIGAMSRFDESSLQAVATPSVIAGPPGGPFTDAAYTFTLANNGNTTANWQVSSVPTWLIPGATSGFLTPGAFQDVTFVLGPAAYALSPGVYVTSITFDNCTGNGATPVPIKLAVADSINCAAPAIDLRPGAPTAESGTLVELGMFITAIGDIDVCAIGIDHRSPSVGDDITVEIYEATGDVRGVLVAANTTVVTDTGLVEHVLPVSAQLAACQDYEIVLKRS